MKSNVKTSSKNSIQFNKSIKQDFWKNLYNKVQNTYEYTLTFTVGIF